MEDQKPFPPPPPEPFRFLLVCDSAVESVKRLVQSDWLRWVPASEFVEDWKRWNECKGMILFGLCREMVSHDTAHLMRKFFERDGKEALVYQLDSITHTFVARDEKWLSPPGRCYH